MLGGEFFFFFLNLNLLITVHFIIEHTSVARIANSGYLKKIRIKDRSVPMYFKNIKEPSIFKNWIFKFL